MADKTNAKPTASASPLLEVSEQQRQEDEWRQQLLQLEKEIQTLKSVLSVKTAEASDLRGRLGISSIQEFKEDVKQSYKLLQESEVVQKANATVKTVSDFATKKFDDLKNSTAVKKLEDKVGGAYNSIRNRLSGSRLFQDQPADGTIPRADENLYGPTTTTTIDHGYEVIDDLSLATADDDKAMMSLDEKK